MTFQDANTQFVNRDKELEHAKGILGQLAVKKSLTDPCVMEYWGMSGIGTTKLLREIEHISQHEYRLDRYFILLEKIRDTDLQNVIESCQQLKYGVLFLDGFGSLSNEAFNSIEKQMYELAKKSQVAIFLGNRVKTKWKDRWLLNRVEHRVISTFKRKDTLKLCKLRGYEELGEQIHRITGGYPFGISLVLQELQDKKFTEEQFLSLQKDLFNKLLPILLSRLLPDVSGELLHALRSLSMPLRFDIDIVSKLLFFDLDDELDRHINSIKLLQDLLALHLVEYDKLKREYQMEPVVQKILRQDLLLNSIDNYKKLCITLLEDTDLKLRNHIISLGKMILDTLYQRMNLSRTNYDTIYHSPMELQNTLLELLDNLRGSLTTVSIVDEVDSFLQTIRADEELQEHFGLYDQDFLDKIKISTQPMSSVQSALHPSLDTSQSLSDAKIQPSSILIVTVTKVEAQAVLELFSQAADKAWTRQAIGSKTYYSLGLHGGVPIFMVQSEMGTATPGGALLTVSQAIQQLHPQAVIMCGIAFGLRQDKQQLGDILIAKQLQYYEPQKVDLQRGQIPRGDRAAVSDRLLDRFRSGDYDWKGPQTHFGLVLSGEKLVNDPAFRDWLLTVEPEAVGGDMEGAGLYLAARDAKVDWIVVKAICDWADGSKNDYSQRLAADNAAQFTLHVLRLGGWSKPD